MPGAMGQPIVVKEKPSSNPGVVRFETNRALTGMGHERYRSTDEVWGERPPDELARRLFARGGVDQVHVNGNIVTVDLTKGFDADGIQRIIETLYLHYPPAGSGAGTPDEADAVAAASDSSDVAEATAAVQATTDATQVARSLSMDSSTPMSASTPAKPRPQDSGIRSARKMPSVDGICQASQLVSAAPQK